MRAFVPCSALVLATLVVGELAAQPPGSGGVLPEVSRVQFGSDGVPALFTFRSEVRTRTVQDPGGVQRTQEFTINLPLQTAIPPQHVWLDREGNRLALAEVRRRVANGVAVITRGSALDPSLREMFSKPTVNLVIEPDA